MRPKWRSFSRKIEMLSGCIIRALNRIPVTRLPNDRCRCLAECFRLKQKADGKRRWRCAAKTKIFTRATSLGGVESLIEHRASIEGPGTTSPEGLLAMLDRPGASGRFNRRSRSGAELTGGTCAVMSQNLGRDGARPSNVSEVFASPDAKTSRTSSTCNKNATPKNAAPLTRIVAKEGEEFFEEAQMFPGIQPPVICQPAN